MSEAAAGVSLRSVEMKQRARDGFDAWARTYDRSPLNRFLFRPAYTMVMEEIARWYAENRRPFRVLDVGCGTGTLASLLGRSPWPVRVVGLDYAAAMCTAAEDKARSLTSGDWSGAKSRPRFINGDAEHLPFADASFDFVTCSNSFHHYPHQQAVITEMRRLLSPDGRLIVIDGFRDCAIGWFVYDVVINRIENGVHHAPWPVMHDYFKNAGLAAIRRRKFGFLFPAFATVGDR